MTEQQTVTQAVAKQIPLQPLLAEYSGEFAKILPRHIGPERFERWSLSMLRTALRQGGSEAAERQRKAWERVLSTGQGQASVMAAFMDCAALGLEPGREYHLVPFGSEVTGITDYKGEIRLINNALPHSVVVAQLVHKEDDFYLLGANVPPRHEAQWFADASVRGPVIGGYAYLDYGADNYSLVIRMSEADFLKHRDKARTKNVWDEWPESMRLKTMIHQLRKWVPWSAEVRP